MCNEAGFIVFHSSIYIFSNVKLNFFREGQNFANNFFDLAEGIQDYLQKKCQWLKQVITKCVPIWPVKMLSLSECAKQDWKWLEVEKQPVAVYLKFSLINGSGKKFPSSHFHKMTVLKK